MLIYNLAVRTYALLIRLSSLRNQKAGQWVAGRRNWRARLREKVEQLGAGKRIWVHCASYGEFEQGRPLVEAIRAEHPGHKIILSFFSPSGYEAFKDWKGADLICYIPLDTKKNAADFIELIDPQTVIFIKYEFWVNFLYELKRRNTPAFLVSAVFKAHHPFFKWYGGLFRRSLEAFSKLFVQDEDSGRLLKSIGIVNFEVSGDTRFDRVMAVKQSFEPLPYFEKMCGGRQVIMAGSTWPADEDLLMKSFKQISLRDSLLVLVPHHVDEKNISSLEQRLIKSGLNYCLYSSQKTDLSVQVLIVDAMGLLSRLYHYATVAYIGGGFDSGIHNCLEPAVYFKPVIFYGGDDYHKYNEAVDMLGMGTARNIKNDDELIAALMELLGDAALLAKIAKTQEVYFSRKTGTTQKVLGLIKW